ncbi:unnamed protein product [Closterium sp. NIES-54]
MPSLRRGRQRAAPHSSFPPTTSPLQTLHMDSKADVRSVLIHWIRTVCRQLRTRFQQDLPVLRLHFDRGGEFSSCLLEDFCGAEGITNLFTLPASPQQNGIAERHTGLVMDVARTSMGPAPSGVSQVDPPLLVALLEVFAETSGPAEGGDPAADNTSATRRSPHLATPPRFPPRPSSPPLRPDDVDYGAAGGGDIGGADSGGAGSGDADCPTGGRVVGTPAGDSGSGRQRRPSGQETLSPRQLREWAVRWGSPGGGAGGAGAGGAGVGVFGGASAGGAGAGGAGATGGTGTGGAVAGGTRGTGATGAGGSGAGGTGATSAGGAGAGGSSTPGCPLPAPSPYTEQTDSLTERREVESYPALPIPAVRRACRVPPPPVPGMHTMALRPSSVPQCVALLSPPASSLPDVPDHESDRARAASPTVTRLLATLVTDPSFESTAPSALVTELVDFAATCRLDYFASLVIESESECPPSVRGEFALGRDVLEDRQFELECLAAIVPHLHSMLLCPEGDLNALDISTPRSYTEAISGECSSQWQIAMDAEMASWKSTGTYVDEVPPPGANTVDGMWIFRVKRPLGSPPAFKARYVAQGFTKRQGVDFFQNFSPTPKMTVLRVLLHVAAQREYELHSLDFSTPFLQGSLHEEIWLRRPPLH